MRDQWNTIVQGGLSAGDVASTGASITLDFESERVKTLAALKYERAMGVIEGLYERHREGNVIQRAVQYVDNHAAGLAVLAKAKVERFALSGVAKLMKGAGKAFGLTALGFSSLGGALDQAAADYGKNMDVPTSLARDSIRGFANAAGSGALSFIGGSAGGAIGGYAAGPPGALVGTLGGAIGGGFIGQEIGDRAGVEVIHAIDRGEWPWE